MKDRDNIKVAGDYSEVFDQCRQILEENQFKVKEVDESSGIIEAELGISWESWGEDITVEVESLGDGENLIKLTSTSKFPLTVFDWGKNNENVKNLLEDLRRL